MIGVVVWPSLMTSCGPAASNPGITVSAEGNQLSPGETAVVPMLYLKIGSLPISGAPSVLSGIPQR